MAYWDGSSKHPVSANNEELVIVLLGSNGDVKASCGNTILGREVFSESSSSLHSFERHDGIVLNRRVVVINTPDLHDLILSPKEQSMKRFLHLAFPGLHAILLVLKPGSFTDLKRDALQLINLIFGEGASEYVIVVFMHEEEMVDESVKDSVSRSVESLIQRCPHYHLQRNGDQSQVLKLLENIEKMVEGNGRHHLKIEKKIRQRSYSVSLDFIMWYDRRSQVFDRPIKRRSSQDFEHPNLCDLRIVLLGKNESENHSVRNLILHESEKNTTLERQNVMKISGRVKGRHVIIIDSIHLLNPNNSRHQITQTVKECVFLCHPGPHVFILTLQYRDFTEEDIRRAKHVLHSFSEEALRRTIIITTDQKTRTSPEIKHTHVHQLVKECGGRHLQLHGRKKESEILKMVDMILMKAWVDKENYLICDIFHDVKETLVEEEEEQNTVDESSRSEAEKNTNSHHKDDEKPRTDEILAVDSHKRRRDEADVRKPTTKGVQPTMKTNLNLVLCGSDTALTVSVSKLLRGKKIKPSQHRTDNEVCVKKAEKIHGHTLSVVELPALSGLSEEEVMRQTLCHPGVHAFIFIVHAGPLTDEDKTEIEKIQKTFDSREHFIVLFISDHANDTPDSIKLSSESQDLISRCGGQYRLMGLKESENSREITELLDYIENMKTEPYSLPMHMKAQENRTSHELDKQHKKEISEKENKIKELTEKNQSEGAEGEADLECLRIVLIGRTGNGKSATGNIVLGRNEFLSQISSDSVTTLCKRGVGKVAGRTVAVVDTPGLFDTTLTNDEMVEEIMKCVSLSSPGPHVFVIVLSLGRFTKEENDTLDLIKNIFGPKSAQFSIVLFTRGDDLQGESIEEYVKRSKSAELKKLIRDCGNRFMVFNNREKDRTQVIQLIKMIEEMKNTNQGRYFSNNMFEETEMNIKKKMEEIMKEREREIESQSETLKAKYDRVMEDMSRRFVGEKQRADEQRMKIQKEFREKKAKLRKEFEEKEKTEQKKKETEHQKQLEEEKQRKAEYHKKIEELERDFENQRSEYEKQQQEREEEDRKREEKYRQDKEKMRNEQDRIIVELQIKQHQETRNMDLEKKQRNEEEEEERQRWKRRMKDAEKERKEEIKRQQREWEEEKKQQMREREEEERKLKEKHKEQLREKQEELEKMRKRFEREREEERQKMEEERQRQRREREEKEREYEEKKQEMKRHYEQLERERKEEWERRKREDEERREEERTRWKKRTEKLKQEQEEEIERIETERRRREEEERDKMKQKYEEEIRQMKRKHEDEARKQAEEFDLRESKLRKEHQKQHEKLQHQLRDEKKEIKELRKQVDELKNKPGCAIS